MEYRHHPLEEQGLTADNCLRPRRLESAAGSGTRPRGPGRRAALLWPATSDLWLPVLRPPDFGLYLCVSAASGGDHGRAAYGRTVRSLQREVARGHVARAEGAEFGLLGGAAVLGERAPDRKSTRLNSSHLGISY